MPIIDEFLKAMLDKGGSDLHLSISQPVKYRVHGSIVKHDENIITPEFMREMLEEICFPKYRWKNFLENHDLDFAYEIPGLARFRCNYLYNQEGMAAVMRQIPSKILTV
ncbi:MAG: type IV pili twitching motility protein PilT, partial [Lentisphaeria bacterium]|nr:type IV pili twitching motility protein PilT [Lentisphaeria bacterium]